MYLRTNGHARTPSSVDREHRRPRPVGVSGVERRVALVTGASRGIGRAVALALAEGGHEIVAIGRDEGTLDALAAEVEHATVVVGDLTDRSLPSALPPRVDVIVHCAAAHPPYARIGRIEDGALDQAVDLSSGALLRLARHALPGMCERRWGRIVAVGALAGTFGGMGQAAYATAKASLLGLVRTLAVEGGLHGVTANLVEPGLVDTERVREAVPEVLRRQLVRQTALGRIGSVDEVAAVVGFLVSEQASFVTGARIEVSGGASLAGTRPEDGA